VSDNFDLRGVGAVESEGLGHFRVYRVCGAGSQERCDLLVVESQLEGKNKESVSIPGNGKGSMDQRLVQLLNFFLSNQTHFKSHLSLKITTNPGRMTQYLTVNYHFN